MRFFAILLALGLATPLAATLATGAVAQECSGSDCPPPDSGGSGGSGCHGTKSDPITS